MALGCGRAATRAAVTKWRVKSPNGLSLFQALQEKLGLKLEARKSPVDILVVDSAEKVPTEN
jgi:uncharacterized protein (TIGR03435 family)